MVFDIVIPTLDAVQAQRAVHTLSSWALYPHNYITIDNSAEPQGYTIPCNNGAKAGSCKVVCFVNDDITIWKKGWDGPLVEEMEKNTYCFGPWMEEEQNMRLNGWFICLRRDYIDAYGWAFDPRFIVWCGDVDLIKRLEKDDIEPVLVKGVSIQHEYSATCTRPELQSWIVPQQLQDLDTYRQKWNSDPNKDKCLQT